MTWQEISEDDMNRILNELGQPEPFTCKHGCERDALMGRIHILTETLEYYAAGIGFSEIEDGGQKARDVLVGEGTRPIELPLEVSGEAIRPTLEAFTAEAEPYLRKAADEVYDRLLYGVQDYLVQNVQLSVWQDIESARRLVTENRKLREVIAFAYGLLWHMNIDRDDDNLRLASDARAELLSLLTEAEQSDGIFRAKGTDARFTGAA